MKHQTLENVAKSSGVVFIQNTTHLALRGWNLDASCFGEGVFSLHLTSCQAHFWKWNTRSFPSFVLLLALIRWSLGPSWNPAEFPLHPLSFRLQTPHWTFFSYICLHSSAYMNRAVWYMVFTCWLFRAGPIHSDLWQEWIHQVHSIGNKGGQGWSCSLLAKDEAHIPAKLKYLLDCIGIKMRTIVSCFWVTENI